MLYMNMILYRNFNFREFYNIDTILSCRSIQFQTNIRRFTLIIILNQHTYIVCVSNHIVLSFFRAIFCISIKKYLFIKIFNLRTKNAF